MTYIFTFTTPTNKRIFYIKNIWTKLFSNWDEFCQKLSERTEKFNEWKIKINT